MTATQESINVRNEFENWERYQRVRGVNPYPKNLTTRYVDGVKVDGWLWEKNEPQRIRS